MNSQTNRSTAATANPGRLRRRIRAVPAAVTTTLLATTAVFAALDPKTPPYKGD